MGVFTRFLIWKNGTKSGKASQMFDWVLKAFISYSSLTLLSFSYFKKTKIQYFSCHLTKPLKGLWRIVEVLKKFMKDRRGFYNIFWDISKQQVKAFNLSFCVIMDLVTNGINILIFAVWIFVIVLIYGNLLLSSYKESSDLLSWSELARNPHKQLICAHPDGDTEPFLIQVMITSREAYLEPSRTSMM